MHDDEIIDMLRERSVLFTSESVRHCIYAFQLVRENEYTVFRQSEIMKSIADQAVLDYKIQILEQIEKEFEDVMEVHNYRHLIVLRNRILAVLGEYHAPLEITKNSTSIGEDVKQGSLDTEKVPSNKNSKGDFVCPHQILGYACKECIDRQ